MSKVSVLLFGVIFAYTGLFSPTTSITNNAKVSRLSFDGPHTYPASVLDSSQSKIKHSATQCALTYRTSPKYDQFKSCRNFLYSSTTGLCNIAHGFKNNLDLYVVGYGDWYISCDSAMEFDHWLRETKSPYNFNLTGTVHKS
ncbi:hypothetical protein RRG08_031104 [Elysia crispata]|uniref:Uncharacterized protein n=1 Tax=Elysia crispata TaxID=231223 RepID=A0AAE0ZH67_9GAST|nr:hypothetical protein RRG08_031104 [Elysia crispata]